MIPTALASGVISGFGGKTGLTPRFTAEQPAGWPSALLPGAPWKVDGGFEIGPVQMTLFHGPLGLDLVGEYTALLKRSGYQEVLVNDEVRGGLVSGPRPHAFCSGSDLVSLIPRDSTATTRSLLVQYVRVERAHSCAEVSATREVESLDLPTLRPPEGLRAREYGSEWSMNGIQQTVQLEGATTAADVLEHYTRQLAAAGWTAEGQPLVRGGAGLQPLSARDKAGTRWDGMIAVFTADERRNVVLRMSKPMGGSQGSTTIR